MTTCYDQETATAMLALIGVSIDPSRAAGLAQTLNLQIDGASRAFASLAFETEPALYLKVSAEESP